MTPTREQEDALFTEWLDAACLVWEPAPDVIEPSPGTHLSSGDVRQLIRVAWVRSHAAARAQALEDAARVCDGIDQAASSNAPALCAEMIRRLKVQP